MLETPPRMEEDRVALRLTAPQARQVADALRIEIASAWDGSWFGPLPDRKEVARLRALLEVYAEPLEMIEWGESPGDVEMRCGRWVAERVAEDLLQGGRERLDNPFDWEADNPRAARRCGRDMIAAGNCIKRGLADGGAGEPGGRGRVSA
jgi:hypothetical protein